MHEFLQYFDNNNELESITMEESDIHQILQNMGFIPVDDVVPTLRSIQNSH